MKIDKKLEWLEPFVSKVLYKFPEVNKISRIVAKSPALNKTNSYEALCESQRGGKFKITLCTSYISNPILEYKTGSIALVSRTRETFSKIDILSNLAHELAHIVHWDHTPEHKILECKILIYFMDILANFGYSSEEGEIEQAKFRKKFGRTSRIP